MTESGILVRNRELNCPEQAFFRLKISGTHLAFIIMVFHRILDFKTGLHFYAGPFFYRSFNIDRHVVAMDYRMRCQYYSEI